MNDSHHAALLGQFHPSYHLEMVADRARTSVIFAALEQTVRQGTRFCELGCGTGIFSIFAAKLGASVDAVELDPVVGAVARENIGRSPFTEQIRFHRANALEVELPQRADIILCEMMSIWCVEEPQVPVCVRARRDLLAPGGCFVPGRIVNLVELGFFPFRYGGVRVAAPLPLFTGYPRPTVFTERVMARELDFSKELTANLDASVRVQAYASGLLNCAVLTSVVEMAPGVVFSGSDSLMPPTVVPLLAEVHVQAGDKVHFQAMLRARTDLGEATFMASRR